MMKNKNGSQHINENQTVSNIYPNNIKFKSNQLTKDLLITELNNKKFLLRNISNQILNVKNLVNKKMISKMRSNLDLVTNPIIIINMKKSPIEKKPNNNSTMYNTTMIINVKTVTITEI